MFKLFVIVMLCVIALHACAADTTLYVVNVPVVDNHYIALVSGTNVYTVELPVAITSDTYTRIW